MSKLMAFAAAIPFSTGLIMSLMLFAHDPTDLSSLLLATIFVLLLIPAFRVLLQRDLP